MDRKLRRLRKLEQEERRRLLESSCGVDAEAFRSMLDSAELCRLADLMVENSIGFIGIPLGIAAGFMIDNRPVAVPMATEEPSVIAAADYAAALAGSGTGFITGGGDPVMTGQVYLEGCSADAPAAVSSRQEEIRNLLREKLASLYARGGGFRGMDVKQLPETGLLRVQLHLHVCDAMGANIINTAAEYAAPLLEAITGGRALMRILSNSGAYRLARAYFSLPVSRLGSGSLSGTEAADRIVLAARLADEDPARAVTHNKGIMNGVTALALATGNDTRGLEAAVHSWAARDGRYRALSRFERLNDRLEGHLEIPVPLGTVGGAVGLHPASRVALRLLGNPDGPRLGRIAAAVGLAQNLAALRALVAEGIQQGHMKLHARRTAWLAGARDEEVGRVAEQIWTDGKIHLEYARQVLTELRGNG